MTSLTLCQHNWICQNGGTSHVPIKERNCRSVWITRLRSCAVCFWVCHACGVISTLLELFLDREKLLQRCRGKGLGVAVIFLCDPPLSLSNSLLSARDCSGLRLSRYLTSSLWLRGRWVIADNQVFWCVGKNWRSFFVSSQRGHVRK